MPRSRMGSAVFGFADLQIRRILRGLERIALRVDQNELGSLAFDLSAQQEIDVEVIIVPFKGGAVEFGDSADLLPDYASGIVKRRGGGESPAGIIIPPNEGDQIASAKRCRW